MCYIVPSAHFSRRFILGTAGADRVICPSLFIFCVAEAIAKQQKSCSRSNMRAAASAGAGTAVAHSRAGLVVYQLNPSPGSVLHKKELCVSGEM